MTTLHHIRPVARPHALLAWLYQAWLRRRAQAATRKLLWSLSNERLKDIGITRADIDRLYSTYSRDDTLRRR